jgi:RNA polymerase sigma-70 factor, ECF subfamily
LVEDADLIRGARAGRQQDFEELVERHQRTLYVFVYRQLQDPDAADDVVQAAFVRAYTELGGFRGDASFKTWLYQIALNECRSLYRARRVRRHVALDEVPEAALPQIEDNPGPGVAGLEGLIAQLPPRQRTVLTLRIFGDLAFKEISRIEGISENAAKVNYHHAVARLKQWLTSEKS